ncbi:hypothetical protein VULLAG_LOCUS11631 [Vulpes lagopus]
MNGAAEGAGLRAPGRGIVGKRKREARPRSPHVSAGVSPPATWPLPEESRAAAASAARGYLGRCRRPRAAPAER